MAGSVIWTCTTGEWGWSDTNNRHFWSMMPLSTMCIFIRTSRYPVGISTEFGFRWQKSLQGGKGKGIRGERERKNNWGKN